MTVSLLRQRKDQSRQGEGAAGPGEGFRRTLPHNRFALPARLELVEAVDEGKDLDGADGIEHVSIVARGRAETAVVMLAREQEVDGAVAGYGVGVSQEVQRGEAPVKAVQA